jgi:TIR domain
MIDESVHPLNVFYSYAHKDAKLRDELGKHLFPLKRQGLIVDWYDRDINAGKEWEQEIDDHLNTAHIILILISSDFWPRSTAMASS